MTELFLFDPHHKEYKDPFGAVVCGECVNLSACALRTEILSVSLVLFSEYKHSCDSLELKWSGMKNEYDIFRILLPTYDEPDILWYCFKLITVDGKTLFYGKNGYRENVDEILSFQITVYSDRYKTPSWFSDGVTYHVFVDRFNRAEVSTPLLDDEYYVVHKDKCEAPLFKPNAKGVVENRDIYGGNLEGIIEKLPYLDSLGVKTIYLSPIFEAWSNHKYNTADYKKIDAHFGDEETLRRLCNGAKKYGIRIILDGVFSHTGSDSIYFNREGRYGENTGAWRDKNSQYREWFDINENGSYSSWWGIDTLPQVNEMNESYQRFIINEDDSVIAHWMRAGVSGWRLDVADELPDEFIDSLKKRALCESKDAIVIGEVWEDASTKKAYGVIKKYFTDGVLDGVMNYPLKNAILDFLCGRISAGRMEASLMTVVENYPKISQRCLMNIIGTHDTVRAINELSVGACNCETKDFRAERELSECELAIGKKRIRQAAVLQYMFPGSPCIYYGDEIGMQGFEDPFNRKYFTWNNIDENLLKFYQVLGKIKVENTCMHSGAFNVPFAKGDVISVSRGEMIAFINRGKKSHLLKLSQSGEMLLENGGCVLNKNILKLPPESCSVIKRRTFLQNE